MDIFIWILIGVLFLVGMAGAIIPVLPGAIAIIAGFILYGWYFGFEAFGWWFWSIQIAIALAIMISDYLISAYGVKVFGGSKRSMIWSLVGLLIGPFVLPVAGLLLGPFIGGTLAEWTLTKDWEKACRAGIGAIVGIFSSAFVQMLLQIVMIVLFFIWM